MSLKELQLDISTISKLPKGFLASLPRLRKPPKTKSGKVKKCKPPSILELDIHNAIQKEPQKYIAAVLKQNYKNFRHGNLKYNRIEAWSSTPRNIHLAYSNEPNGAPSLNPIAFVFDFYAIYTLWFSLHGKEEYGYKNDTLLCEPRRKALDNKMEFVTKRLSLCIIDALDRALKRECRHVGDETNCNVNSNRIDHSKLTFDQLLTLFSLDSWSDGFGGVKWAQGALAIKHLTKAYNESNIKQMIIWIDIILDLQHNNGFILNKTEFRVLSTSLLNFRAKVRSIDMLSVYCSNPIYKFICSYNNFIATPLKSHRYLIGTKIFTLQVTTAVATQLQTLWSRTKVNRPRLLTKTLLNAGANTSIIPRGDRDKTFRYSYINDPEMLREVFISTRS